MTVKKPQNNTKSPNFFFSSIFIQFIINPDKGIINDPKFKYSVFRLVNQQNMQTLTYVTSSAQILFMLKYYAMVEITE